jgi:hypothetical protein
VDLDEGLHVLALTVNPGSPAVKLTGALGAVEVDLIADDDGHSPVIALAVDCYMDLALEGIESEGLSHLDELELLLLGELAGKTESGEVVEKGLLLNLDGGRGRAFARLGGEG